MKKLSFIRLLLPVLLVGLALVSCQDNECCDDMGIKEYDMSKTICVSVDGHLQIQSLGFRVIGRMVTMMLPYF